jgi:pimeloyl-ACP methyl ester carboxylesterase
MAKTGTVEIGGAPIHVAEWGSGPPVLLVHGNPDSSLMWEGMAPRLAHRVHCIAPDLPGFGRSEVPEGFVPSLEGMAEFIEAFRCAAGVGEPLDAVGHDFGGAFVLAWAWRHTDKVRRLVLINTVFFGDYRWHFWARMWRTPLLGELSMALVTRGLFARELNRGSGTPLDSAHISRTWALMTPHMRKMVLRLYRAVDPRRLSSWERELPGLMTRMATLVVWGDLDPYIPSRFAERFGAAEVVHLPRTGHWPPVEEPEETARHILRFLGG